ncbi:hypothetical protein BsIDN1_39200 [Bacillus safensis]|uniref:Uncharacterized protein n=1 Tax=Bacillus safensis TaxID=561879 RepID=A0A5S9MCL0_BACIA|nr:hypothetical protein BsIDN1_39200 [Bacillus safensis]
MAAGMLMPMVRFALDPVLKGTEDQDMVQVVSVDELTKEPKRFDFKIDQVDAWYESKESRSAWVYKEGDEIVALSPICKHLGCTVNWNSDPKKIQTNFSARAIMGCTTRMVQTYPELHRLHRLTIISSK